MNRFQKAGCCLAAVAAVGLLAYAGAAQFFSTHFMPGTVCGGVQLTGLDAEAARAKLADVSAETGSFRLIPAEGEAEVLPFSAFDGVRLYEQEALEKAIRRQDSRGWLLGLWQETVLSIPSTVEYDSAALKEAIASLALMDEASMEAPKSAYLAAEESGGFVIVPEEIGSTVDGEVLTEAVSCALAAGNEELDLLEAGCYLLPKVTKETPSLQQTLQALNAYEGWHIQLDFCGGLVEELPADTLFGFLQLMGPETETEIVPAMAAGTYVRVNREAIFGYMEALAARYDTASEQGRRLFNACDGHTVSIKTRYGWRLDVEKSTDALTAAITDCLDASRLASAAAADTASGLAGMLAVSEQAAPEAVSEAAAEEASAETEQQAESGAEVDKLTGPTVALVWKQQAVSHAPRDIGDTYAEVDLTGQMVHFIKDGLCVFESPCVTGLLARGRATPDGIYQLTYKQPGKVLTGYNPDGSVSYRSPVSFWMPFNGGIGFHDATWRSRFGGAIYRTNGSHGCVNMPYQKAKELYGLIEKGIPVVCYF